MKDEQALEDKSAMASVRAVSRALDVLLAFRAGEEDVLVADLLKRVDLSRPTLYRLLATLEQKNFLVSSGEPQRFRLGPAVAQLAHAWSASLDFGKVAQPMMRRLWEATRETVALFVPNGTDRVCVAELESPQPLSFRRGVGYRESLVLGASGRSILAHMNLTPQDLMSFAGDRALDAQKYMKKLGQTRERGYETSRDELIQGAVAVAAPFFDGAGNVAGSMSIFGPSTRMSPQAIEACSRLLVAATNDLSRALGQPDTRSTKREQIR